MNKQYFALNRLKWLICNKTEPKDQLSNLFVIRKQITILFLYSSSILYCKDSTIHIRFDIENNIGLTFPYHYISITSFLHVIRGKETC